MEGFDVGAAVGAAESVGANDGGAVGGGDGWVVGSDVGVNDGAGDVGRSVDGIGDGGVDGSGDGSDGFLAREERVERDDLRAADPRSTYEPSAERRGPLPPKARLTRPAVEVFVAPPGWQ